MSLTYEPSSEPLHISAKQLFLKRDHTARPSAMSAALLRWIEVLTSTSRSVGPASGQRVHSVSSWYYSLNFVRSSPPRVGVGVPILPTLPTFIQRGPARCRRRSSGGSRCSRPPRALSGPAGPPRDMQGHSLCFPMSVFKRHLPDRAVESSSGSNVTPRRARPGLAGLGPQRTGIIQHGPARYRQRSSGGWRCSRPPRALLGPLAARWCRASGQAGPPRDRRVRLRTEGSHSFFFFFITLKPRVE